MSSPLWIAIEPRIVETRLLLSVPGVGTALRARLPLLPQQPQALATLLTALSAWYGAPCCAVLDAAAEDVWQHPERWARLLGELDDERIWVEWVWPPSPRAAARDRFLGAVGDFARAKRLLTFAATGQR